MQKKKKNKTSILNHISHDKLKQISFDHIILLLESKPKINQNVSNALLTMLFLEILFIIETN